MLYPTNMNVGKVIRGYRESRQLSVRALASQIGVEHTKLWRFENGREVQARVWVRIFLWLLRDESETN